MNRLLQQVKADYAGKKVCGQYLWAIARNRAGQCTRCDSHKLPTSMLCQECKDKVRDYHRNWRNKKRGTSERTIAGVPIHDRGAMLALKRRVAAMKGDVAQIAKNIGVSPAFVFKSRRMAMEGEL